jgi:hypothetical protein
MTATCTYTARYSGVYDLHEQVGRVRGTDRRIDAHTFFKDVCFTMTKVITERLEVIVSLDIDNDELCSAPMVRAETVAKSTYCSNQSGIRLIECSLACCNISFRQCSVLNATAAMLSVSTSHKTNKESYKIKNDFHFTHQPRH